MPTYTVTNTRSGATLGTYDGRTAAHAIVAMLRDAGHSARVEDSEVVLGDDAPETVRAGLHEIQATWFCLATIKPVKANGCTTYRVVVNGRALTRPAGANRSVANFASIEEAHEFARQRGYTVQSDAR